jgi:hypothetical protein
MFWHRRQTSLRLEAFPPTLTHGGANSAVWTKKVLEIVPRRHRAAAIRRSVSML